MDVVDLSLTNIEQTSAPAKGTLTRLLKRYRHVCPTNPKIIAACNGMKLQLP